MVLYIGKNKKSSESEIPEVCIPLSLVDWTRKMGYAGEDALSWLREAVYRSAPITHPEGNRRYCDLLMTVKDNRLTSLVPYEPECVECNDLKKFVAYETCPTCNGNCDIELCTASTVREWPCQACNKKLDKRGSTWENGSISSSKKRKHRKSRSRRYHESNAKERRQ